MSKEADDIKTEILEDNEILYKMYVRPMNETCMCWGLEVPNTWILAVDKMSKSLEALNLIFYPKFGVRIQMDQVKSKYGLLTCYYTIAYDPPRWMCIWHDLFQSMFDRMSKIDFKFKRVVDEEERMEVKEEIIESREKFENAKKAYKNSSNVELIEKDGKFIKRYSYCRCARCHSEPTQHKFIYKILKMRHIIENLPARLFVFEPSHMQLCIGELLGYKANEIISNAEKDCFETCEMCGKHISDNSYSPRCMTRGWVSYICKECAEKSGQQYILDGYVWENGKKLQPEQNSRKENNNEDS